MYGKILGKQKLQLGREGLNRPSPSVTPHQIPPEQSYFLKFSLIKREWGVVRRGGRGGERGRNGKKGDKKR